MPIKRSHLLVALWIFFVCQAFAAASAAAEETDPMTRQCTEPRYALDQRPKLLHIENRYPLGQESKLGEGWVQLGFTVTPAGDVKNVWLIDIVGAPIFAHAAAGALVKAKYAAPLLQGKPVEYHGAFESQFQFRDGNRAGIHAKVGSNYDLAQAARAQGDYRRSIEILKENLKLTLNMYEYAITSYALTVSYLGLGDRRRALIHARHTAVDEGSFADRGQRKGALALLAELEARDNNYLYSLCAFATLKKKYPDVQLTAELQGLLTTARRELDATTPVHSEVELVEPGRDDLPTMWTHAVTRPTLQFSAVQGPVKSLRVVCPTAEREEQFPLSQVINVDRSVGACTLFVFGDPGARFVLDER